MIDHNVKEAHILKLTVTVSLHINKRPYVDNQHVILMLFLFSFAGINLNLQSATYGLKDSPAHALLTATRATGSSTSMARYALSSPSLPVFAKTEHGAPYWKTTFNLFS